MTLGVVITNYNSWHITQQCVAAHLKFAGSNLNKVVVVDDCSTLSGTIQSDPIVRIVRNEQNLGFVRSVNVGFRHIDTDIVLLFDADAEPLMDYSKVVVSEFENNPKLGVIGFSTFNNQGEKTGSSETEPGPLSLILGQKLYHKFQRFIKQRPEQLVVYSCTMAVRKAAFDSVGGFDENFDWLDPDNDFCMSLRSKGWEVNYSDELKAYHEGGGTPQIVSHRVLRFYKNRWYLLKKHNKINNVALVKGLILLRLNLEYLFLKIGGKLLFRNPEVYQDKLIGRRKIIDYCKVNYN